MAKVLGKLPAESPIWKKAGQTYSAYEYYGPRPDIDEYPHPGLNRSCAATALPGCIDRLLTAFSSFISHTNRRPIPHESSS